MRIPGSIACVAGAALLCLSLPLSASAANHATPARVGELAATVQALLDTAVTSPGQAEARALLQHGQTQAAGGDLKGARATLQRAYEAATRMVIDERTGQRVATERSDQYAVKPSGDRALALAQARIEAIRSLLDAYGRIAPEKGGIDRVAMDEVTRLLEMAQAAALAGQGGQARIDAEAAYASITTLVASVRNGDRLVKTLAFDSPADEFRYEQDRFASYRMLLTLAAAEQGKDGDPQVAAAAADGEAMSARAALVAEAGDWPGAIRLLEQATATLVKAIRATGRFIPS